MSAERELAQFLARYDPAVARLATAARATMRQLLPSAVELVYDNYNALAIAYGPSERPSEVILSITVYPRWVSLFFTHGVDLPDPTRRLKGSGKRIRHLVLNDATTLDEPPVRAIIAAAVANSAKAFDPSQPNRVIIQSISAKQRPRR